MKANNFGLIAGRRYRVTGIGGSVHEFIAGSGPIIYDVIIDSVSLKRVFKWYNPATWLFREKLKR